MSKSRRGRCKCGFEVSRRPDGEYVCGFCGYDSEGPYIPPKTPPQPKKETKYACPDCKTMLYFDIRVYAQCPDCERVYTRKECVRY